MTDRETQLLAERDALVATLTNTHRRLEIERSRRRMVERMAADAEERNGELKRERDALLVEVGEQKLRQRYPESELPH